MISQSRVIKNELLDIGDLVDHLIVQSTVQQEEIASLKRMLA